MARLKVKQIADFTSAVQNLIDNDADQNASIIAQISEDLSSEVSATGSEVVSIDTVLAGLAGSATVSSLEDRISDEEDALQAEISTTNSEVLSLDAYVDGVSADLSTEISTTNSEVLSLDAYIDDQKDRIDAILAGSAADLDAFAEVISYVDSLDTADGGALTSQIASLDTRVSLNTSSDVVLSAALSTEISTTNSEVLSLDAYIDGVSADLSSEISATNADVASIDTELTGLAVADTRLHQLGVFASPTSFTLPLAVAHSATTDILVFINGHNIHVESEGVDGWNTADGQNFNLAGIGYDIDGEDHIYVVAPRA